MALLRKSNPRLDKRPLASAISKRYPHLTRDQTEQFADEIIKQIAKAIRSGKNLAFIEMVDDDIKIDVISLVDHVVSKAIAR